MRSRTSNTPSPEPRSSPPPAPPQEGEQERVAATDRSSSPTNTLWTAPSPTQTLGHSSPELPPLPPLPTLSRIPQTPTPSTSSRQNPTESSYYTASWGSPYQNPPEEDCSRGAHRHKLTLSSDDFEEDSPGHRFGLSHLLPARLPQFQVTPTRPSTPSPDFAPEQTPRPPSSTFNSLQYLASRPERQDETWVQRFLEGTWAANQNNWWTGDSDKENRLSPGVQDSITSEEFDRPRAEASEARKHVTDAPGKNSGFRRHKTRNSNLTLVQQDFWESANQQGIPGADAMLASKYAVVQPSDRRVSKPGPAESDFALNKCLPTPPAPERLGVAIATPRARKRVAVNGKTWWISLPVDAVRGGEGNPPRPLSQSEVESRLKKFEQDGYDTRGFVHSGDPTAIGGFDHPVQNRCIFPEPGEHHKDVEKKNFRVRIPDFRVWEAYQKDLVEQKLRALGVSLGDEPSQDAPPPMSRQNSAQYRASTFSPPLPTSSAASQRPIHTLNGILPPFRPGSSNHMSTRSIASPISSMGNPRGHMHRQSMFTTSPPPFPQQPTPPGFLGWSPQQFMGPQGVIRGGSPAITPMRPDLADRMSPVSPYVHHQEPQFPFGQREDLIQQMQRQQQQLQAHLQQQHQRLQQQKHLEQQHLPIVRPQSTLEEVPEVEEGEIAEEPKPVPPPEIAIPKPSHRHNISVKLERDIQNADYHLEEYIDRQLDEDEGFNTEPKFSGRPIGQRPNGTTDANASTATWLRDQQNLQNAQISQPVNGAHSQKPAGRDQPIPGNSSTDEATPADVTESNLDLDLATDPTEAEKDDGRDTQEKSQHSHNPSQASFSSVPQSASPTRASFRRTNHSSKSSISKLNVAAKEFNPGSFNPGIFSSSAFASQPAKGQAAVSNGPREASFSPPGSRPSLPGLGSTFNVSAPSFNPAGFGGSSVPSGNFNFMSQGPAFKPTAPGFQPTSPAVAVSCDVGALSSDHPEKIFKDVTLSDVVPPARRNKAVPIVRPNPTPSPKHDEGQEDEDGRPMQADSRLKRARHFGDDGDQEPMFAMPSNGFLQDYMDAGKEESAPPGAEERAGTERVAGSDNESEKPSISADAEDTVSLIEEATPASRGRSFGFDADAESSGIDTPFETDKYASLDANIRLDTPTSDTGKLEGKVSDDEASIADEWDSDPSAEAKAAEQSSRPSMSKHSSKGSLSALAKPFEPIAFKFNPGVKPKESVGDVRSAAENSDRGSQSEKTATSPPYPISSPPTSFLPNSNMSHTGASDAGRHSKHQASEGLEYSPLVQASFNEIDEVMKHLNEEGSDFGVERDEPAWAHTSPGLNPMETVERTGFKVPNPIRSDAPSPSPRRLHVPAAAVDADSSSVSRDPFGDDRAIPGYESPVKLNDAADVPISDWDDALSSREEDRFHARTQFFDSHVDNLIGAVLQNHLTPLEQNIREIQDALAAIADRDTPRKSRQTLSGMDSDADDEDDDEAIEYRPTSRPRSDRRIEKLKDVVLEALAVQHRAGAQPAFDSSELYQALSDIKTSVALSVSKTLQLDDVKDVVEEAIHRQNMALVQNREQAIMAEDTERFAEFAGTLKEAALKMNVEIEARIDAERREAETQKFLRLAEEELALRGESARDGDHHVVALQETQDKLREEVSTLTQQNAALEATLDEYRISSDKWRHDIDEANAEKESMADTLASMRFRTEESTRIRQVMRERLDKLQVGMSSAAAQMASERSNWQRADQEHRTRYEILTARIGAEARTRERLEAEMERLEAREREGMKLKVMLEQSQNESAKQEQIAENCKTESLEQQKLADQYAREFREAREAGRVEVQRTRVLMEADIETANNQVNIVRADLESDIASLRAELENVRMDADTAKEKHELLLEQEADAKRDALAEALEARNNALTEQRLLYEQRLEELRQSRTRVTEAAQEERQRIEVHYNGRLEEQRDIFEQRLEELRLSHGASLTNAVEEKQRSETYLNERLGLADSKVDHLQDKILHLEEKLEVAKSAAHAAALHAQTAKAPQAAPAVSHVPEKISPQALRESIQVLQEQLQERESRIETLEHQLDEVDTEAPSKLKERDTEIGWLRELLGVRIDDISDLVNALSQPAFDREHVRNAAIRIRTSLQMEQQEKERQLSGSQNFSTLASISNFASPKAVQLAAAIGSWRKGRDFTPSGLGLSQSVSNSTSRDQTPTHRAAGSAQGFLSGLMTPPTSNVRRTPGPSSRRGSARPTASVDDAQMLTPRLRGKQAALVPSTPPLMRQGSYDQDARDGQYSSAGFYDDDESTVDGERGPFEPFGPMMGQESPVGPRRRRQS